MSYVSLSCTRTIVGDGSTRKNPPHHNRTRDRYTEKGRFAGLHCCRGVSVGATGRSPLNEPGIREFPSSGQNANRFQLTAVH